MESLKSAPDRHKVLPLDSGKNIGRKTMKGFQSAEPKKVVDSTGYWGKLNGSGCWTRVLATKVVGRRSWCSQAAVLAFVCNLEYVYLCGYAKRISSTFLKCPMVNAVIVLLSMQAQARLLLPAAHSLKNALRFTLPFSSADSWLLSVLYLLLG